MADNVLGFIATIDVTDLQAGLSQIKKAINQTKNEFNTATAGLDNWQKSSVGVNAKLTQLNAQFEAQKKAVEAYELEMERVKYVHGENSKQVEIVKEKLQKAKDAVSKTQAQIDKYSKSYEILKKKEDEENSANSKLLKSLDDNKKKLSELENQYKSAVLTHGKYSKEAKAVESQVKKTSKEIKDQESQVKKLEDSYSNLTNTTEAFKTVGKTLLAGVATVGASIGVLVGKLTSISDETEEYRKNQARLANTFKDVGLSAESLEENYNKLYSVVANDDKVTESLSFLAQLGGTEEDLSKITTTLIGVYAKWGDAIPINQLSQNINEAIKTGEVTGQLSDAIKQAGEDEEVFKSFLALCSTEQERQNLILRTLSSNYDELGETYLANNKALTANNDTQREYNETMAELGKVGDEIKVKLTELKTKVLEKVYPLIKTTIDYVSKNLKTLATVGITVGTIATAFTLAEKAMQGWNAVVKLGTALQTVWNAVCNANPIGKLITGATALVALGIAVYKNWAKIKNFFVGFWNSISSFFAPIKDKLAEIFSIENIKNAWDNLVSFFKELPATIINFFKELPERLGAFFSTAWEGIKKVFENPGEFFETLVNSIVGFFKDIPARLVKIFTDAWEGIKKGWNEFKDWFSRNAEAEARVYTEEENQQYYNEIKGTRTSNETLENQRRQITEEVMVEYHLDHDKIEQLKNKFGDIFDVRDQLNLWEQSGVSFEEYFGNLENLQAKSLQTQESQLQASAERQEDIYEEKTRKALEELNTALEAELATAENDEAVDIIKDKYKTTFDKIKSTYDSYVAKGHEANAEIVKSFEELEPKVTKSFEELEPKVTKSVKNLPKTFEQVMGEVQQTVSKYTSQIASTFSSITGIISDFYQQELDQLDNDYDKYCDELDAKQKAYEEQCQAEIDATEAKYAEESALNEEARQAELDANAQAYLDGKIDDKEYFLNKYKIEEKYNTKAEKDTKQKDEAISKSNANVTAYAKKLEEEKLAKEKEVLAEKNKIAEKQFKAEKANQIAQVWLNAATATIACFAQLGPIGGAIAAAIVAGVATAQTVLIAKQQYTPITAMATGGVVDEPTYALIGEAGKEAVMPLENNTGWINELANQLNELMQKDFGTEQLQATPAGAMYYYGDTINNYNYEQTINSPKSLTRAEIYKDSKSLLSLKKY